MQIEYRFGNLLDHPGRFILHGCNAQGVMGSGVAKAIRAFYPRCYDIYHARHLERPLALGEIVVADCDRFVFFNAITQEFFGSDGARYVSYEAMASAMQQANKLLKSELDPTAEFNSVEYHLVRQSDQAIPELAMPLVGAGLAGGDWGIIREIIETESTNFKPVVYIMDQVQFDKITTGT